MVVAFHHRGVAGLQTPTGPPSRLDQPHPQFQIRCKHRLHRICYVLSMANTQKDGIPASPDLPTQIRNGLRTIERLGEIAADDPTEAVRMEAMGAAPGTVQAAYLRHVQVLALADIATTLRKLHDEVQRIRGMM